jgi:AraC-like DNA-binding protein
MAAEGGVQAEARAGNTRHSRWAWNTQGRAPGDRGLHHGAPMSYCDAQPQGRIEEHRAGFIHLVSHCYPLAGQWRPLAWKLLFNSQDAPSERAEKYCRGCAVMNSKADSQFRDIRIERFDLEGARSWMSGICGPHRLETASPERIRFHHSANVFRSRATTLGTIEYGTDVTVDIEDAERFSSYSLSLPLCGEQELSKDGVRLMSNPDQGVIISPNESQVLAISGDCRKVQVVITRSAMGEALEDLLQRPLDAPLRFEAAMNAVDGASASWWRMARYFIAELESSNELYEQVAFTRDIESSLIKGLILAQPNNYSEELREVLGVKLPHYLLRARQYIHDNAREALHLEDLEAAAGVSRFKLFEAFRKYFALSPMAYLKKHRLNAVRQELLEHGSARNISEIALGWGFTHLGRFSAEYRKLFDESPSTTLQRHQARRLSGF